MTEIRQEAIQMLEKVPEDKLGFVIQIMRGVNGLIGVPETEKKAEIFRKRFLRSGLDSGEVIPPQPFHPLPAAPRISSRWRSRSSG